VPVVRPKELIVDPFQVEEAETALPLPNPFGTISLFNDILIPNGPFGSVVAELASMVFFEQPMVCGPEMPISEVGLVTFDSPMTTFAPAPPLLPSRFQLTLRYHQ